MARRLWRCDRARRGGGKGWSAMAVAVQNGAQTEGELGSGGRLAGEEDVAVVLVSGRLF